MIRKHFEDMVLACLGFSFSPTQKQAMACFAEFFLKNEEEGAFVLKGYAGTGKTSFVAAVVNAIVKMDYKVVLLAPTGRAAKLFSTYAGQPAFTIHKKIYRQKTTIEGEGNFNLGFNPGANTLFFVDEASMISNATEESNFGSGRLLDDLVEYVYNGRNNRLVLIGDEAQLPPVGLDMSPALEPQTLRFLYNLEVYEARLTNVMRQAEESGILYNATSVRGLIGTGCVDLRLKVGSFPDVRKIGGGELLEEIETCYGKFGIDETMVVCRSNKRANRYNEGIRRMILYREEDFCSGDKVMVVKNNYFWGKDYEHLDFIANGDVATIVRTGKRMELYGFHFVRADIVLMGYEEEISAWVMLDTLFSDYPALNYEETKIFYRNVEADFSEIRSRKKRFEKVRENEYYNALQVKFAYAVTCHKAQGGQWDAVFIDQGWIPKEMLNDEYWRWLYTAVTRARKKVYFVNFKEEFFEGE